MVFLRSTECELRTGEDGEIPHAFRTWADASPDLAHALDGQAPQPGDAMPDRAAGDWSFDDAADQDGAGAFTEASASWRRAVLHFARSVRRFNAAARRHHGMRRQVECRSATPHPLDADEALPRSVQPTPAARDDTPEASPLTRRQREVAVLIARGHSDKQIAEELQAWPFRALDRPTSAASSDLVRPPSEGPMACFVLVPQRTSAVL